MEFVNLPTLYEKFLRPSRMVFDAKGFGIAGAKNGWGDAAASEHSGGGTLTGAYERCFVHEPEQFEYTNGLAARLNLGNRAINVPILTRWMGPFPLDANGIPQPTIEGIPHSDGALFGDGSGYSQATVFGVMAANAALGAGRITIDIFGASRRLRWSDWFSLYHSVKGWRAYRYWEASDPAEITREVDGVTLAGQRYTLSLEWPLRQAIEAGAHVEFARPLCAMKFPKGFTLPYDAEGWWMSRPSLQFIEAM